MLRPVFRRLGAGKLTILTFHKVPLTAHPLAPGEVTLATFERVLKLALEVFQILPLTEALAALKANRLPPAAACITFDDGYPDWLQGPIPLLQKHQAHATFFITTGQFHGEPMWNERILHAIAAAPSHAQALEFQGVACRPLLFDTPNHRTQTIQTLDMLLKYQPPEKKERLLAQLEAHAGVSRTHAPVMSADDVRAIHAMGFGIGAHSVSHPILSMCTPAQALQEMAGARESLEAIIRAPVSAFAYPNGIPGQDFTAEHVAIAKQAGYSCALTTQAGVATAETPLFQVPRFTPWGPEPLRMVWQLARNFREPPKLVEELPSGKRKVLMVAFHFPPQAGSSGILRTLNFVKYLPRNGWQPTVLSAHPRAYVECRDDLLKSIPPETRVVRAQALDAAKHLSIKGKYPGWFALPDRWASWWLGGLVAGLRIIREQKPDVIWSTYPIATAHLIAYSLAKRTGLPWIADFRDPMINGGYPSNRLQRKTWQWLESRVFQQATRCVFTTERAAQLYRSRYPAQAHKCLVIENGYDEEAFEGNAPQRTGVPEGGILMLHSGIIYPQERDPSAFFAAVRAWLDAGGADASKLIIRFRAPYHGDEVAQLAALHGLTANVEIAPPVPYQVAIAEMLGADLLLVFQGSSFNAQVPAKIYEYLRTGNPVLGLVDPAGDTAKKLAEFKRVGLADIQSPQAIQAVLEEWYESRKDEGAADASAFNIQTIRSNSRLSHAMRLASVLAESSTRTVVSDKAYDLA
jgi:peptidoglycan/xylan/chitin deacetylase (PgdA/CDA1 family)/glycosyltransferase involved in cell wall biosynthesis